jgi:hypothetical protein
MAHSFLQSVLDGLAVMRRYPKFQHERRADVLLFPFLQDVFTSIFGYGKVTVFPEFPLRHRRSNRSTNVDYLVYDGRSHRLHFVELKTTAASYSAVQLTRYRDALTKGWGNLVADVHTIAKRSRPAANRKKYLDYAEELRLLSPGERRQVTYIAPAATLEKMNRAREQAVLAQPELLGSKELRDAALVLIALEDIGKLVRSRRFPREWQLLASHLGNLV